MTVLEVCDYCESMASYSLPGHWVELSTLARVEADAFGLAPSELDRVRDLLGYRFDREAGGHPGTYWLQLAWVRAAVLEVIGPVRVGLEVWRSNLAYWSDRANRSGLAWVELGRRVSDYLSGACVCDPGRGVFNHPAPDVCEGSA